MKEKMGKEIEKEKSIYFKMIWKTTNFWLKWKVAVFKWTIFFLKSMKNSFKTKLSPISASNQTYKGLKSKIISWKIITGFIKKRFGIKNINLINKRKLNVKYVFKSISILFPFFKSECFAVSKFTNIILYIRVQFDE